jgi:hypothetical protein
MEVLGPQARTWIKTTEKIAIQVQSSESQMLESTQLHVTPQHVFLHVA